MTRTEPLFKIEQSEAQFQASVVQLATALGWEWMHVRGRQQVSGFYRTPTEGSLGSGWPDLVLAKGNKLIFAELKSERGKLSERQRWVIAVLVEAGQKVYIWRPSDWDSIVDTLTYTLTQEVQSL